MHPKLLRALDIMTSAYRVFLPRAISQENARKAHSG